MEKKNPKINFLINHYFSQQEGTHLQRKKEKEETNNSTIQGNIWTQNWKSTPVQNQDLFTAYRVVLSNSHCTYFAWLMTL